MLPQQETEKDRESTVNNDSSLEQLLELINNWSEHKKNNPRAGLREFYTAMLTADAPELLRGTVAGQSLMAKNYMPDDDMMTGEILRLLYRIVKVSTLYSKKALEETAMTSPEEFGYLNLLVRLGSPKRSDLIRESMMEYTSGLEVIKRLTENGYVEELPDSEDKRSKRISITSEGKNALVLSYPHMAKATAIVGQHISTSEKALLIIILTRLDTIHSSIQYQSKSLTLDEILELMQIE